MSASPETGNETTQWFPSPVRRVRTYGKHSDTRWLDDQAISVAEILARLVAPGWPTEEVA